MTGARAGESPLTMSSFVLKTKKEKQLVARDSFTPVRLIR
jgi:hypothetical protein